MTRFLSIIHKKERIVMERYSADQYTPESALDDFVRNTGYKREDFEVRQPMRLCRRK